MRELNINLDMVNAHLISGHGNCVGYAAAIRYVGADRFDR